MSAHTDLQPRRRILVVTNETARGDELYDAVVAQTERSDPRSDVLVVAPALNSRLRHWLSEDAAARRAAIERVHECVTRLAGAGIAAEGTIGDPDPLQAIEDALGTFPADSLVIATHPAERSHWLERGLVERADERFDLPITHVVVGAPRSAHVAIAAGTAGYARSTETSAAERYRLLTEQLRVGELTTAATPAR